MRSPIVPQRRLTREGERIQMMLSMVHCTRGVTDMRYYHVIRGTGPLTQALGVQGSKSPVSLDTGLKRRDLFASLELREVEVGQEGMCA